MNWYLVVQIFIISLIVDVSLQATVYREKPADFNPSAPTVGCCYLHYRDQILLLHRQDRKAEGNRWGIPGGKIKSGEDCVAGTAREVFEETGLRLKQNLMRSLGNLYIRVPGFDFEYHMFDYLEQIANPAQIQIDFKEHKGFTWITPQEALSMNLITDEDTCFKLVFNEATATPPFVLQQELPQHPVSK